MRGELAYLGAVGALGALVLVAPARAEEGWTRLDGSDGYLIEGRPAGSGKLREIRLSTSSPLEPEQIFAVLWDVDTQHEFVPNVQEQRVLHRAEDEVVLYRRVKIPVVQDRDYVLRLTKKIDPQTRVHQVFAEGQGDGPPATRGVVRMTKISSTFTVEPSPEGGSRITYVSFGDPAGGVPQWIVRAADVRGPKDFVRAILRRAQQLAARR